MTQEKPVMGPKEREEAGLETYETGQWVKFALNNTNFFYGTRGNIDTENGTIEFDKLTEYVYNEKGCVLGSIDEPTTFRLEDIARFRKATKEEVDASIENQSRFYQYWGKYIAVQDGSITIPGKLHKITNDSIQLLPVLCTHCGKAYIETETPRTIAADSVKSIAPSSEEELEYSVKRLEEQQTKGEEKDETSIIMP
ncbi:hypothetical protein KY338_06290 [Candidatus Woesearchaeota archaeon]|nr:hypothetical protein [Candidatus Woesearchaeota archaeon]MBW3006499.1 hypothetical protein [Candidatus Woesearchaeota archaeon]